MNRLTEYDNVRKIYRLKADCNMGENIQRLGQLEDRDEVKVVVREEKYFCKNCEFEIKNKSFFFCPVCGQRLKEGLHDI